MPPLTTEFQERIRPFIDLIDRLRQYGLDKDVNLPAVTVIGDQSAGKSSTLEAISGIQLPRGTGIMTRCPLELRLKSHPKLDSWKARIFYHKQGQDCIDIDIDNPAMVGKEVLKAQDVLAGHEKGINENLITLEVEAHDIPDLTLIDLPGITRVPVKGQPADIGEQVKRLIMKYIRKPETIILAVVPANVDIATTEALTMAKEVDSGLARTLGVVTKPDLIDPGTELELIAVVENLSYPLKKGYSVVKCRGQAAIEKDQTLAEAMKQEQTFFEDHDILSNLDPMLCGVKSLSSKLTNELVNHIKDSIPALKDDVKERLQKTETELYNLGVGPPKELKEQTRFLVELLHSYVSGVSKVSRGDYEGIPGKKRLRLYTKARTLYDELAKTLWKQIPCKPGKHNRKMIECIQKEIDEQRGRELPQVWKFSIIEEFIRENLANYRNPASDCLIQVNTNLEEVLANLASATMGTFPLLKRKIEGLVNKLRNKAFVSCQDKMKEAFAMEEQIFTQDPVYWEKLDKWKDMRKKQKAHNKSFHLKKCPRSPSYSPRSPSYSPTSPSHTSTASANIIPEQENDTGDKFIESKVADATAMFNVICTYLDIATGRIADNIPMIISYQMLECLSKEIEGQVLSLAADKATLELLEEDKVVAHRRLMLEKKISRLTDATWELAKF